MIRILKEAYKASYRMLGYYPVTIQGSKYRCDPCHARFWRDLSKGGWEPETFRILSRFLKPASVYSDIGAWIGPAVLHAARKCKQVFCFEPDPFAYEYLLSNLRLNQFRNVTPFNIALTDRDGIAKMASFGEGLGDSMSSLLDADETEGTTTVTCMKWQTWLDFARPTPIDFMKIDTEGGEFALLPALGDYLAEHKPVVYLSTHAPYLEANERQEAMQRVLDVMRIYRTCLDCHMEPVSLNELTADATINEFRSFVFMD